MKHASHNFDGRLERESGDKRPALVAVDLGADSCRVSLLRWIEGQPEIQLPPPPLSFWISPGYYREFVK